MTVPNKITFCRIILSVLLINSWTHSNSFGLLVNELEEKIASGRLSKLIKFTSAPNFLNELW